MFSNLNFIPISSIKIGVTPYSVDNIKNMAFLVLLYVLFSSLFIFNNSIAFNINFNSFCSISSISFNLFIQLLITFSKLSLTAE